MEENADLSGELFVRQACLHSPAQSGREQALSMTARPHGFSVVTSDEAPAVAGKMIKLLNTHKAKTRIVNRSVTAGWEVRLINEY